MSRRHWAEMGETTFVAGSAPAAWQKAVQPNTRLLFLETPSNPTMEIFDIAAISQIAKWVPCLTIDAIEVPRFGRAIP